MVTNLLNQEKKTDVSARELFTSHTLLMWMRIHGFIYFWLIPVYCVFRVLIHRPLLSLSLVFFFIVHSIEIIHHTSVMYFILLCVFSFVFKKYNLFFVARLCRLELTKLIVWHSCVCAWIVRNSSVYATLQYLYLFFSSLITQYGRSHLVFK